MDGSWYPPEINPFFLLKINVSIFHDSGTFLSY
jgi:hypothetical protein